MSKTPRRTGGASPTPRDLGVHMHPAFSKLNALPMDEFTSPNRVTTSNASVHLQSTIGGSSPPYSRSSNSDSTVNGSATKSISYMQTLNQRGSVHTNTPIMFKAKDHKGDAIEPPHVVESVTTRFLYAVQPREVKNVAAQVSSPTSPARAVDTKYALSPERSDTYKSNSTVHQETKPITAVHVNGKSMVDIPIIINKSLHHVKRIEIPSSYDELVETWQLIERTNLRNEELEVSNNQIVKEMDELTRTTDTKVKQYADQLKEASAGRSKLEAAISDLESYLQTMKTLQQKKIEKQLQDIDYLQLEVESLKRKKFELDSLHCTEQTKRMEAEASTKEMKLKLDLYNNSLMQLRLEKAALVVDTTNLDKENALLKSRAHAAEEEKLQMERNVDELIQRKLADADKQIKRWWHEVQEVSENVDKESQRVNNLKVKLEGERDKLVTKEDLLEDEKLILKKEREAIRKEKMEWDEERALFKKVKGMEEEYNRRLDRLTQVRTNLRLILNLYQQNYDPSASASGTQTSPSMGGAGGFGTPGSPTGADREVGGSDRRRSSMSPNKRQIGGGWEKVDREKPDVSVGHLISALSSWSFEDPLSDPVQRLFGATKAARVGSASRRPSLSLSPSSSSTPRERERDNSVESGSSNTSGKGAGAGAGPVAATADAETKKEEVSASDDGNVEEDGADAEVPGMGLVARREAVNMGGSEPWYWHHVSAGIESTNLQEVAEKETEAMVASAKERSRVSSVSTVLSPRAKDSRKNSRSMPADGANDMVAVVEGEDTDREWGDDKAETKVKLAFFQTMDEQGEGNITTGNTSNTSNNNNNNINNMYNSSNSDSSGSKDIDGASSASPSLEKAKDEEGEEDTAALANVSFYDDGDADSGGDAKGLIDVSAAAPISQLVSTVLTSVRTHSPWYRFGGNLAKEVSSAVQQATGQPSVYMSIPDFGDEAAQEDDKASQEGASQGNAAATTPAAAAEKKKEEEEWRKKIKGITSAVVQQTAVVAEKRLVNKKHYNDAANAAAVVAAERREQKDRFVCAAAEAARIGKDRADGGLHPADSVDGGGGVSDGGHTGATADASSAADPAIEELKRQYLMRKREATAQLQERLDVLRISQEWRQGAEGGASLVRGGSYDSLMNYSPDESPIHTPYGNQTGVVKEESLSISPDNERSHSHTPVIGPAVASVKKAGTEQNNTVNRDTEAPMLIMTATPADTGSLIMPESKAASVYAPAYNPLADISPSDSPSPFLSLTPRLSLSPRLSFLPRTIACPATRNGNGGADGLVVGSGPVGIVKLNDPEDAATHVDGLDADLLDFKLELSVSAASRREGTEADGQQEMHLDQHQELYGHRKDSSGTGSGGNSVNGDVASVGTSPGPGPVVETDAGYYQNQLFESQNLADRVQTVGSPPSFSTMYAAVASSDSTNGGVGGVGELTSRGDFQAENPTGASADRAGLNDDHTDEGEEDYEYEEDVGDAVSAGEQGHLHVRSLSHNGITREDLEDHERALHEEIARLENHLLSLHSETAQKDAKDAERVKEQQEEMRAMLRHQLMLLQKEQRHHLKKQNRLLEMQQRELEERQHKEQQRMAAEREEIKRKLSEQEQQMKKKAMWWSSSMKEMKKQQQQQLQEQQQQQEQQRRRQTIKVVEKIVREEDAKMRDREENKDTGRSDDNDGSRGGGDGGVDAELSAIDAEILKLTERITELQQKEHSKKSSAREKMLATKQRQILTSRITSLQASKVARLAIMLKKDPASIKDLEGHGASIAGGGASASASASALSGGEPLKMMIKEKIEQERERRTGKDWYKRPSVMMLEKMQLQQEKPAPTTGETGSEKRRRRTLPLGSRRNEGGRGEQFAMH